MAAFALGRLAAAAPDALRAAGRRAATGAARHARRADRPPRGVPEHLPERRAGAPLARFGRARARSRRRAGRRQRADRGGGTPARAAARGEGRVRSGAAVHRRRLRCLAGRAVRALGRPALSHGAAAAGAAWRRRSAAQDAPRAVADAGPARARRRARRARHAARPLRPHPRAAARAPAGARLRGADRRGARIADAPTTTRSPWRSPRCPRRSAATATSSWPTSSARRRAGASCSTVSTAARRRPRRA